MSPRSSLARLDDMLEAVEKILRYTAGMTSDQLQADAKTLDAVIMNFSVLGEAASAVPDEIQSRWPDIPWRVITDMRNVITHQYFKVSPDILWETIQTQAPPLAEQLRDLVRTLEGESP